MIIRLLCGLTIGGLLASAIVVPIHLGFWWVPVLMAAIIGGLIAIQEEPGL